MIDRIQQILDAKKLSATQFSEEIGIQRSSLSHVLSGRNKPSLDFMLKIKSRYPDINLNWLLLGDGEMNEKEISAVGIVNETLPDESQQIDFGSTEVLAKQLANINQYQYINIINIEGDVIVNEQRKPTFIDEYLLAPKSQIKLTNSDLIIQFQLAAHTQLKSLQLTLVNVFIISLSFAVLLMPLIIARSRKFAKKIDQQVTRELAFIIAEKESPLTANRNDTSLPEIEKSLIDLRTLIANKITATTLLEKDAYIEPVTKLENRNRFVQFFENANSRSNFANIIITLMITMYLVNCL